MADPIRRQGQGCACTDQRGALDVYIEGDMKFQRGGWLAVEFEI